MSISPIRSVLAAPVAPAVKAAGSVHSFGAVGRLRTGAFGLLLKVRAEVAGSTRELAPHRQTRRAFRQRHRAEIAAKRIIRDALRDEAAIRRRVRAKLREEASIEHTLEGRIRLAYSAAELHAMMQTALRLNIQV